MPCIICATIIYIQNSYVNRCILMIYNMLYINSEYNLPGLMAKFIEIATIYHESAE
jgi:hypothetical protein